MFIHIHHAQDSKSRGKNPIHGGMMKKYSDGIFCSVVTVHLVFATLFETPLSMSLIREGRKITKGLSTLVHKCGLNAHSIHFDAHLSIHTKCAFDSLPAKPPPEVFSIRFCPLNQFRQFARDG